MAWHGGRYTKPTDHPLTKSRWYLDVNGRRMTWSRPLTPALHTKNKCGTEDSPILDIPESANVVEFVLNNLSPTAHTIHLHGLLFQVRVVVVNGFCYSARVRARVCVCVCACV